VILIERQGEDLNMQAELEHRPDVQLEEWPFILMAVQALGEYACMRPTQNHRKPSLDQVHR
jgi:hypothetical protein